MNTTVQRVAVVTGGTGGIGRAICEALAAAGHRVVAADLDGERAEKVAATFGGSGAAVDVTRAASVDGAVRTVESTIGPVGILVNCAGFDSLRPFHETDEALQDKILEVNLGGTLRVTRAVLPGMIGSGWGRIVNISSEAGRLGGPLEVLYSAAKAGVIGATKALAREYASQGITVNCVSPGPTDTPLFRQVNESGADAERAMARITKAIPLHRLGEPEEVAASVAYFCSDAAAYVTGQTLSVSGGLSMV